MSKISNSILLNSDSYKGSMNVQYPPGTEYVYSYVESRGGVYDQVVFFGLQTFIKQYLTKPITQAEINFAEKVWKGNGMPFNREGWEYILNTHKGKLPVKIRAVLEGTVVPTKNVLAVIENTDPQVPWLTTWIETALLRAIWYPTTVATVSWDIKQVLRDYLEKSGDVIGLPWKLHDFGARGVSSYESANIGGAAHLVNFKGTDTISALSLVVEDYNADVAQIGYSIPATEHSTITSWGREHELDAYRNMLTQYAKPGAVLACVSDSYDIYKACEMWSTDLKNQIVESGATLVIRPDSGDPAIVLPKMLKILEKNFGVVKNEKGYKILNHVRIIWGDGIDNLALRSILMIVVDVCGFSADNFAFGMGGGLLQKVDRDTQKFAMKCSAAKVDGVWIKVSKDPITDPGKKSKEGRVTLFKNSEGYYSGVEDCNKDELVDYFLNGDLLIDQTFEEIRTRSEEN